MSPIDGASAVVFCPACGQRFVVAAAALVADHIVLLCTACSEGSLLSSDDRQRAEPMVDADRLALEEASWPRVVVGHEVPAAARAIADALRRGRLAPVCVRSGDAVLAAIDPSMPAPAAAIVLDVGIPGVMAFEIIDAVRQHPALREVLIILLASVYEKTRYKRRPNRLYGADAYLELHHVPDRLAEVLGSLLRHTPPGEERNQAPVERARAAGLRLGPPDGEGARTLVRRLLSDVAIYHGDEVARGLREGDPFQHIVDAIEAARVLHERAGGDRVSFDDELRAFSMRLLDARGRGGRFG